MTGPLAIAGAEYWLMRIVMEPGDSRIRDVETVREAGRRGWVHLESGELAEPLECFDRPEKAAEAMAEMARPGVAFVCVMNVDLPDL